MRKTLSKWPRTTIRQEKIEKEANIRCRLQKKNKRGIFSALLHINLPNQDHVFRKNTCSGYATLPIPHLDIGLNGCLMIPVNAHVIYPIHVHYESFLIYPAQKGRTHAFIGEHICPVLDIAIRCDNGGLAVISSIKNDEKRLSYPDKLLLVLPADRCLQSTEMYVLCAL